LAHRRSERLLAVRDRAISMIVRGNRVRTGGRL
jgi:hypothetical protein